MDFEELYLTASKLVCPRRLSSTVKVGMVSCALETVYGNVYTGICAEISCSLGFCAEQAAISQMISAGENDIKKLVTVYRNGEIIPPCGKCRELIFHVSYNSLDNLQIMIEKNRIVLFNDIAPLAWYSIIQEIREENMKLMGSDYV